MNKTMKKVVIYTGILSAMTYAGFNLTSNINEGTVCHINSSEIEDVNRFSKQIVAHRGLSSSKIENSYEAVETAFENEAVSMVEIDIQLTNDGYIVLFHDDDVAKLTNGSGKIKDLNLSQLKSLDYYSRDISNYAELIMAFNKNARKKLVSNGKITTIATMEEILSIDTDKTLLVDIKFDEENSDLLIKKLSSLIKGYSGDMKFIFQSMNAEQLKKLRGSLPDYEYQIIINSKDSYRQNFEEFDHLAIRHNVLNEDMVEEIHKAGKSLSIWTVNSKTDYEQSFETIKDYYDNVTYVTDFPECICYWLSKDIKNLEKDDKKMILVR